MTDREKYLKLKTDRDALAARLGAIPSERQKLVEESAPLAEQAIRSEFLGDGRTAALRSAVKKNSDELSRLSAELDEGRIRLKVMNEVLQEFALKAKAELTAPNVQRFKAALADFIVALRRAADAERKAFAVRESVREAFDEIDGACPVDAWQPVVLRNSGGDALQPQIESFLDRVKATLGVEA